VASLEDIGRPKASLLDKQLDECQKVLVDFANGLVQDSKKKLRAAGKGEGVLESSITPKFNMTTYKFGKPLTLQISMADYWDYVDGDGFKWGRRPKRKMPWDKAKNKSPLEEWIQTNANVQASLKAKFGRDTPLKSLAFIVGRSIAEKGIKAVPFWTSTINDGRLNKLNDDMSKCFAKDISVIIDDTFKDKHRS
jgi:hypothetical protein